MRLEPTPTALPSLLTSAQTLFLIRSRSRELGVKPEAYLVWETQLHPQQQVQRSHDPGAWEQAANGREVFPSHQVKSNESRSQGQTDSSGKGDVDSCLVTGSAEQEASRRTTHVSWFYLSAKGSRVYQGLRCP